MTYTMYDLQTILISALVNVGLTTFVFAIYTWTLPGADPGFQVRGGGEHKKNCAERREE